MTGAPGLGPGSTTEGCARRWSGEWGREGRPTTPVVDVLVPTSGRTAELAVTLAGLAAQNGPAFSVLVSDQSPDGVSLSAPAVTAMLRVLAAQGHGVRITRHLPRRGLAEHRQFLLDQATAPMVLMLDDDVWLEPGQLARLVDALGTLRCGFVGSAVQGLSYLSDVRPEQQQPFEPWDGPVRPERVRRGSAATGRVALHNAANLTHLAAGLDVPRGGWLAYKVAWVGGCVLFDREALVDAGGFEFWPDLPPEHAGEDVVAQWRVMERRGGAGIVPSGAVHLEAPTTVPVREVDAPDIVLEPSGSHGGAGPG